MKFSIITPSFRGSDWLRLCIASVADQEGVEHEHIVQDSCSDDGTQEWLPQDARVRAFIEKDTGMYDAVNRGIRRASGEIVAYLNCDEQYLPGALQTVGEFFAEHPEIDIALGDMVVTHADGTYVCHRKSMTPVQWHLAYRFSIPTAGLFIRRRVFDELGLWFNTEWKAMADFLWIEEACRRGVRWAEVQAFTSTFADTGSNLGLTPAAVREQETVLARLPRWQKYLRPVVVWHNRWRMLVRGAFTQAPFSYRIYTHDNPSQRVEFTAAKPTGLWHTRLPKGGSFAKYVISGE
jgi:glycosyltransferase involved in cell wall biosynthesis